MVIIHIYKTNDAQCNCTPLTNRCPASPQAVAALLVSIKFFPMMSYAMEYLFVQLRSTVPSQLLLPFIPLTGRTIWKVETSLALHSHCSATIKPWRVITFVFLPK